MSFKFRPMLSALEGREVPAAFSFQLSNTGIGSGLFSTPEGVDAAQSSQTLALTDLSIVVSGDRLDLDGPATATYANGVLVGVAATGSCREGVLTVSGTSVSLDDYSNVYTGSAVYDAADTQFVFAMPDRTEGAISFAVPWGQVDPTLPSQSLTPTAFNLNIAGQNVSGGFTTAPTLTFEYGDLVGVNFAVGALAGAGYSSLSVSGLAVTAVQAWNNEVLFTTAAANGPGSIIADFKDFTPPPATAGNVEVSFRIKLSDTNEINVKVNVNSNTTIAGLRALFKTALKNDWNFTAEDIGDKQLQFHGKVGQEIKSIQFFGFGVNGLGAPVESGTTKNKDGTSPEWIAST